MEPTDNMNPTDDAAAVNADGVATPAEEVVVDADAEAAADTSADAE